jgi:hypothetical protein
MLRPWMWLQRLTDFPFFSRHHCFSNSDAGFFIGFPAYFNFKDLAILK